MLIPGARAHDYGKDSPENLFARIAADGWETIQLAFKKAISGVEQSGISAALTEQTAAALAQNGLSAGVLGAYVEPSLAEEAARKKEVDAFCSQIPVAAKLGALCIATETTNMQKQPGVTRKQALTCLRLSLAQMLETAEMYRVTVAIEPVFYHAMDTPEETRSVLRDMQSPWLKVVFDPVNLLASGLVKNQQDLWQRAFDCFGANIAAVHIKGVRQANGNMLACPLAESIVDYAAIFEGLRPLARLPKDIPLLREELAPSNAKEDLAFFRSNLC